MPAAESHNPAEVAGGIHALLTDSRRSDLADRVAQATECWKARGCTIVVAGEFKMGKSTLINAVINAPVCPVDDDVATAKPLQLAYSDEPNAAAVYRIEEGDIEPEIREITFEDLAGYVSEPVTAPDAAQVSMVRVGLPRKLFANGMSLIDTPGVGGIGSSHSAITIGTMPLADAVLFVSDAAQELTAPELEFLDMVRSICTNVAMVMPKVDFYPHWREIAELNRGHFEKRGLDVPILPVSSTLRQLAVKQNSSELNRESGFETLVAHLRDPIEAEARTRAMADLGAALSSALGELSSQLVSECAILDDPDEAARRVRDIEKQRDEAESLRGKAARWQQTLNDGIADLTADIDHDLKARFRELTKEIEDEIDDDDPARIWDDFAASVTDRVNRVVVTNFSLLHQRFLSLTENVAEHFEDDHRAIASAIQVSNPGQLQSAPSLEEASVSNRKGMASSSLTVLKGGMGGAMMAKIAGTFLFPPSAIAIAGVAMLMGRKARSEEATRELDKRRREAKQSMRRYVDEAQFTAGKDVRDSIRIVNRQLRDMFVERADELNVSTKETLAAAQQAMKADAAARQDRRRVVTELLDRVPVLAEQARAMETLQHR